MADNKVKKISLFLSIAYMFFLFLISSLPDGMESHNILTTIPPGFQNLLHVPAYGVLTLLWIATLKLYRYRDRSAVLGAAVLAILYGAGIEYYQGFVPGRFSSMSDLLLNLMGIVILATIYALFKSYFPGFRMGLFKHHSQGNTNVNR